MASRDPLRGIGAYFMLMMNFACVGAMITAGSLSITSGKIQGVALGIFIVILSLGIGINDIRRLKMIVPYMLFLDFFLGRSLLYIFIGTFAFALDGVLLYISLIIFGTALIFLIAHFALSDYAYPDSLTGYGRFEDPDDEFEMRGRRSVSGSGGRRSSRSSAFGPRVDSFRRRSMVREF